MNNEGFLGVLGGMGPLATADFLAKLVSRTGADSDQQNIPTLLYSDCTTPDRTAGMTGKGPSPLPKLTDGIRFLNNANVKAICIPCNSAHYWIKEMQAISVAPILDISHASVSLAREKNPQATNIGVLSTYGTYQTGIYRKALAAAGFHPVEPSNSDFESLISPAIKLVKSNQIGKAESLLRTASEHLFDQGAEVIIMGCTEIPIGLRAIELESPELYVDSTTALAASAVEFFRGTPLLKS